MVSATGETRDMSGADPTGRLILTPDGRMMTLVTRNDRPLPAAAEASAEAAPYRDMMAYSGASRLQGARSSPGSTPPGTDRDRTFTLDGDRLSIVTVEVSHPMLKRRAQPFSWKYP